MFIVRPLGLVEVVHIQLPDERREVVVLEESREDSLRELILFQDNECFSICGPADNGVIFLVLLHS